MSSSSGVHYITVLVLAASALVAQPCTDYSFNTSPAPYSNFDTKEHKNGYHAWREVPQGSCTYSGGSASSNGPVPCSVDSEASTVFDSANSYDTGQLTTTIDHHVGTFAQVSGIATANDGASAVAATEGAYAVQSCLLDCGTIITFTGGLSAGPVDGSVSVVDNPNPIWPDKHNYTNTCGGVTLPQAACVSPTSPYPGQSTQNGYYTWNPASCTWVWVPCEPGINCSVSPIIIDTRETGYAFTDPTKGQYVTFDIRGDGKPLKLSWLQANSGNAWLAYDRDGDGVIKDGTELFGNFTPHSNFTNPNLPPNAWNGFIALGWYDQPENGGTGDQIIDKHDAIWKKLRLWIDNHCYKEPDTPCQSLPSELHKLEEFGITSISVVYQYDPQNYDAIGNRFKLWSYLNPDLEKEATDERGHHMEDHTQPGLPEGQRSQEGRKAYDVYLVSVP